MQGPVLHLSLGIDDSLRSIPVVDLTTLGGTQQSPPALQEIPLEAGASGTAAGQAQIADKETSGEDIDNSNSEAF